MRVLAVCVGINRQQDPDLKVLPFAGDDASALWALVSDWSEALAGGRFEPEDCVRLTDVDATRANVLAALDAAAERSALGSYDLALIHFAGHGESTGHLLTYDATEGAPESGISLDEIAAATGRIRAGHIVIAFDACFSGRAGLLEPRRATACGDAAEVMAQLTALADERRAVLWACGADERAYESPRLGHGLLSYGLVHALEQPERLERGTDLSLTDWIGQALRTAAHEAALEGRTQTPGMRLTWQGVTALPRPTLGPRRRAQLAEREIFDITPDTASLGAYGFDSNILDAVARRIGGGRLTEMQRRAVAPGGLLAGRNLVVSAPTSTGKTLIGELAALGARHRGRRSVILMPARALVQEKYEEFAATFGPAGVVAVRSYGGVEDEDAALAALQFDVAFMTYEKCLAYCLTRPDLLDALGAVILDEAHLLGDKERGRSVELLLALVRERQAQGQDIQVVALSAALGDLGGLPEWIRAATVMPDPRPVPLRVGVVDPTGRYRYRVEIGDRTTEGTEQLFPAVLIPHGGPAYARPRRAREAVTTAVIERVLKDEDGQALIFRAHRPETRALARQLGQACALGPSRDAVARLAPAGMASDESRASAQLRECLESGVAFHLSDLELRERAIVEQAIGDGDVRVTVATSTLAMGINTPATDVVVVDSERYGGATLGNVKFSVGEMRNMVGRAGRWIAGAREGRAFIVAASTPEADELYAEYVVGAPEPLVSQLDRMKHDDMVIALVGSGRAESTAEVVEAALDTFYGFQHGGDTHWRQEFRRGLRAAVTRLVQAGLVNREVNAGADDRLTLTAVGSVCARESLRSASAAAVLAGADAIARAGEPLDEIALVVLAQITEELDAVPTSMSRNDSGQWNAPTQRLLPKRRVTVRTLAHADGDKHTCRLKRVCAILAWVRGVPLRDIEADFGRHYPDADGQTFAGPIRTIAERTAHVLRGLAALLAAREPNRAAEFQAMVRVLRPRLELGIERAAADLGRARLGLSRAEICALAADGCTSAEALAEALERAPDRMAALFGSSRAA
ncbi:MAG TPA: DEAD/DEAH box helicase, partial [Gemmatimonadales bacterium]|nr:DEAD/DEAH box helicase [Gemmatimonadales bacterium]